MARRLVPNAQVLVENLDSVGNDGFFTRNLTADANGNYQATGVQVGNVLVEAQDPNGNAGLAMGTLNPPELRPLT